MSHTAHLPSSQAQANAAPVIRNKLISVVDKQGAENLAIILQDDIKHVEKGNRWHLALCAQRYGAPNLQGRFNLPARRAAGFTDAELSALCVTPSSC